MKQWRHWFTYAGMDAATLAPPTNPSIIFKIKVQIAVSRLVRHSNCWYDIFGVVRCAYLVAVPTVSACGNFLSYIRACALSHTFARLRFAGMRVTHKRFTILGVNLWHSCLCVTYLFHLLCLLKYLLLFLKGGENPPISLQPRIILIPNNRRYQYHLP